VSGFGVVPRLPPRWRTAPGDEDIMGAKLGREGLTRQGKKIERTRRGGCQPQEQLWFLLQLCDSDWLLTPLPEVFLKSWPAVALVSCRRVQVPSPTFRLSCDLTSADMDASPFRLHLILYTHMPTWYFMVTTCGDQIATRRSADTVDCPAELILKDKQSRSKTSGRREKVTGSDRCYTRDSCNCGMVVWHPRAAPW